MSGTSYTGNPANFNETVQLLLDSDPQRATTYNPAYQQLADDIAFLFERYG